VGYPPFVLFCKSYSGDYLRVERLLISIERFNKECIPLYLSVPKGEINLFAKLIAKFQKTYLIADQDIVSSNFRVRPEIYDALDGRISQQAIKSEFWRYWMQRYSNSEKDELVYLCIDSESEFIRDFYIADFFANPKVPFTVCHDNSELLESAAKNRVKKVEINFKRDCLALKNIFDRTGADYAFSPTPVVWSSKVWEDLEKLFLQPRGRTIWDAILEAPNELHWYGESLLRYKSIPFEPRQPFFRVYHYDWQFYSSEKAGETIDALKNNYLGVLRQSSWDHDLDFGYQRSRKGRLSKAVREIKRWLKKIYYRT